MVRTFAHGAMGRRIDLHGVDPLSYFTTGVTKAVVCIILFVRSCI